MKTMNLNKLHFAWMLFVVLGVSVSCSKDEDNNPQSATADLTVTIDGQTWSGNITELTQGNTVTLTATSGATSSLQLLMPTDTVGTFDLSDIVPVGIQYMPSFGQVFNDMQSGTFVITQNSSTQRSGTFNAVIASTTNPGNTVVMTNGVFNFR